MTPTPKICIPIAVKPEGGMYTFVGNLMGWLHRQHLPYTTDIDADYDVLFTNSWVVSPKVVRQVKRTRPDVKVVQRMDGSAADYGGNPASDRVQARVNLLADATIFQSEYSRYSTREKFRVIAKDGPVIYNPVDAVQFNPEGSRRALPQGQPLVACASWSVNRGKGTWRIEQLAKDHPDVTFVLCGRFDIADAAPNVVSLGHLSRAEMAEALRSCHVFLNLSENDPCPNVVLEAMASGLPVLYRDSGGVPELVADCGLPVTPETFAGMLARLRENPGLGARARARAATCFSPDVIFPQYMEAFAAARRTPMPSRLQMLRLAGEGYPVLPRLRTPGEVIGAIERRAPAIVRHLTARGGGGLRSKRVGWVTYDSFPGRKRRLTRLDSFTGMRVGNVARWINAHDTGIVNELYVPGRRYDAVVFQKMMDARCQAEAKTIQAYGGKVIFDANVNYYETWGDYFMPGTQPTEEQQRDAIRMTTMADSVVADSTYLRNIIQGFNPRVRWIADNVDLSVYSGVRKHGPSAPLRLVWSGIGKKAAHLLLIKDVLAQLKGMELILVVDEPPACLPELQQAIPCSVVSFSDKTYAATLITCDVIISPKRLVNAYEMGHTEYKITLGMAVGLPAVASPQPSYVEAIGHRGGGIIADTPDEWRNAFERLGASHALRQELGERARQTVAERYATSVIAAEYLSLLREVVGVGDAVRPVSVE